MDAERKERIALFAASLPVPYRLWAAIETLACICQGKGWGSTSLHHEIKAASQFLRTPPKCIVDVGANVGNYTQTWLDAAHDNGSTASIECHLFEPSRTNIATLQARFSGHTHVHIYPFALSDYSAILPLYTNVPGSALGSLSPRDLGFLSIDMNLLEDVCVERFDQLVASGSVGICKDIEIDLLKIDVEGHELSVLRGIGDLITKIKLVQFEFSSANLDTQSTFLDFWKFFDAHGFELFRITPRGSVRIPRYVDTLENYRLSNVLAVARRLL